MTVWSRDGWRRGWVAFGCIALVVAVVIPVVVWIVRDLSTAAKVAAVVSIPLAAVPVLLGLVATLSGGVDSGTDEQSPFWTRVYRFWTRVRCWAAALLRIRQRWQSRRAVALIVVGVLLTAGLVVADRVVGNQPGPDLLARVPESLQKDCSQATAPAVKGTSAVLNLAASAVLNCQDASGQEIVIRLFDTEPTMDNAYGEIIRRADVPRGSGDCATTTGAEHRYPGIGAPTGRALCYRQEGNIFLVWTNDAARTVAVARRGDGNDVELYRFWASLVGIRSFPTPDEQSLLDITDETHCRRAPAGSLDRFPGVVAAVTCEAGDPGADTVSFYRFANLDALQRSYNTQVRDVQAQPRRGCTDGEAPGFLAEEGWNTGTVTLGRLLCYPGQQGTLGMEWTVESLLVLGQAVGTDPPALSEWWREDSGPPAETILAALNMQIGFPNPAEQALLDHVPAASRVRCTRPSAEQISDDVSSAPIAAIVCNPDDGPRTVFYYQLPDTATMAANYEDNTYAGPDCFSIPPDFTGEAVYSNGTATGRLACATGNSSNLPYLVWTHDRLNILAFAYEDDDPAMLLSWWRDKAGPV